MISPLSSARWKLLEPLIDAAVSLPRAGWPAFLHDACGEDAGLRADLEQLLLQFDRADTLLDHPAAQRFGSLLGVVAVPPPELVNGNYRIERKLGQGGMAAVYLAHDVRHDRKVAVKVLHPELSAAFRAEQFLAEIRTMAQLHHPHILPLHDSGEVDGLLFYVMPYVEGETLRQRIDRETQLGIEEVVRITGEVAGALDSAHRHGVIHRDIKPENILLGEGGALVADFGIALAVSTASARDASQPGWIAGTPRYMSPEQMSGEGTIDSGSDVYSLGVVTYEMLAGQPPSTGPTINAIVAGTIAQSPSSLHSLRGVIPPAADSVVAKALARLPEDRYRTASEFAEALQRSVVVRGTRRRAVLVASGIIALTAAVVGTTLVRRQGAASTALHTATGTAPYGLHQTRNLGAYDLYTRGREVVLGGTRNEERQIEAIKYFKQAIAVDSTYAAAYAELAHMYVTVDLAGGVASVSRLDALSLAHATALKAVAMDSTLADAWAVLGLVNMTVHDMRSAKAALDRALALDTSSPRVHGLLGWYYGWVERPAEALAEAQRESELDPLSVLAGFDLASALYGSGRYDEALAQLDKLRDVDPPLARTGMLAGAIYLSKGLFAEAVRTYQEWDDQNAWTGRALALAGRRAEARRMLAQELADYTPEGGAEAVFLLYEGLGDYDQAFAWLDKAIEDHSLWGTIMWPTFAHLRADPRFERIRRRLNGGAL